MNDKVCIYEFYLIKSTFNYVTKNTFYCENLEI